MKQLTRDLLTFAQKVEGKHTSTMWDNILLFNGFLNMRCFQPMRELKPGMDELSVEISFDKMGFPTLKCSDMFNLSGHFMMPFSQQFVEDIANDLCLYYGSEEQIKVEAFFPEDIGSAGFLFQTKKENVSISKKAAKAPANITAENIGLFISFLKMRGFQKILELEPVMNELCVEISFNEWGVPTLNCSNMLTLTGHFMMPFSQQFVEDIANALRNIQNTEEDIGIKVYFPGDNGDNAGYQFWTYTDRG